MSDDGFVPMGNGLQVRIEGDLVHVRNQGQLMLKDLQALLDVYARVHKEHGVFFFMYDVSQSMGVHSEARKALATPQPGAPMANATAVFGASFTIRTVANMIERALVGLGRKSTGMVFFETEEQARAYIDQQRLKWKSKN